MKKALFVLVCLIAIETIHSQLYFNENFKYLDYLDFQDVNDEEFKRWTYWHSVNFDFNENGEIDKWEDIKETCIVNDFGYQDRSCLKFRFNKMDKDNLVNLLKDSLMYEINYNNIARNEIATWDAPNHTQYLPQKEYGLEYSVYIPQDFEFEKGDGSGCGQNFDIIGQWHFHGYALPPINMQIRGNAWYLVLNPENDYDNAKHPCGPKAYKICDVETETWVTWKFNIVFSTKEKKGKVRLWKDNVPMLTDVLEGNFKTAYEDRGLYFKMGVYKPHWWARNSITTVREFYVDKIKIYKIKKFKRFWKKLTRSKKREYIGSEGVIN